MKVVVFDDDPTGSQTVHSCPLLLATDAASLRRGLAHPSPLLFVLANTRALAPDQARERVASICDNLAAAMAQITAQDPDLAARLQPLVLVSRGDSTLRGHFPLELQVIEQQLAAPLGWGASGVDGRFLVPAFLPGGRTTVGGEHRLNGEPVHTSDFARDRLFGYDTSDLAEYIAAKTAALGRDGQDESVNPISPFNPISPASVQRLGLAELEGDPQALVARLAGLAPGAWVVVDAERPQHLSALGAAVLELMAPAAAERWGRPRRFLFQSAASLLNGLVALPPPPHDAAGLAALRRRDAAGCPLPALVLVGSHVPLADAQLTALLAEPACQGVQVDVRRLARVLEGPAAPELLASLQQAWLEQLRAVLASGRTPVLHTSRGEVPCRSAAERRRLGLALAGVMAHLAAELAPAGGCVISKGGITSHTLLAEGLGCSAVELQGQLLPGLSLVLTGPEARVPALPVLTFPGNLGDADTLRQAWQLLGGSPGPGRPGC